MIAENRKILLFLDNFSGHSSNKVNIILIFIMKNSIGRFTLKNIYILLGTRAVCINEYSVRILRC